MRTAGLAFCFLLAVLARATLADCPRFLWVTNSNEGTVSKLDAPTGAEVARYASVTRRSDALVNHVGRPIPAWGAANNPQNVAVDFYGNAWVTNLAPSAQPSATKIVNDEPLCFDRNGNQEIDTSREVNGTPGIQIADALEFFGEDDECIAFTVVLGDLDGWARALAIDRGLDPDDGGNAWIGIYNEQAFYQIEGATGAILQRVPPSGAGGNNPFSAAIDGDGTLWATHACCAAPRLWRIDTLTGAHSTILPSGLACNGSFGTTIDLAGKVWIGGWPCAAATVYDPDTSSWFQAAVSGHSGWGGLGIGLDLRGNVWMAMATSGLTDGRVARIDATTALNTGVWDNAGEVPIGAAVGLDGDVFSVNAGSNDVSRLHIDPITLEPAPHPGTGNVVDLFPVGDVIESNGDFTGLAMQTIVRPRPPGHIFSDGFRSGSANCWSGVVP